jgi:hypothetical protein
MSLAIKLQSASSDFQKLQNNMAETVSARQKLEAQLSENELVKKVRTLKLPFVLEIKIIPRNLPISRRKMSFTSRLARFSSNRISRMQKALSIHA